MSNNEIAISVVSKVSGVTKRTILSLKRTWPAVEARMLIILLLSRDGASDKLISLVLKRKQGTILKSRHNAIVTLGISKAFSNKFNRAKEMYENQKSLRISQG